MTSTLSYRFEPTTDLYLFLLSDAVPDGPAWEPARRAIARLASRISDAVGRSSMVEVAVHGEIAEATSVAELEAFRDLLTPEHQMLGVPWLDVVKDGIDAIRLAEAAYMGDVADAHKRIIDDALVDGVHPLLDARAADCISFITSGLEVTDADVEIPVRLVVSGPRPGAFTSRSDKTGAICFVAVDGLGPTTLVEMILHEATHALDLTSPARATSVLDRLQSAVDAAGLGGDPAMAQVRHSLFFVHTAEAVRRRIDPEHVHYGVTHTYYDRVPPSKVVLRHWVRHLDGETDADGAIDAIVAELATP